MHELQRLCLTRKERLQGFASPWAVFVKCLFLHCSSSCKLCCGILRSFLDGKRCLLMLAVLRALYLT